MKGFGNMEFFGWCIGLSIVLWICVGFISMFCNSINHCVEIKKDVEKIKENNKKK